jgi:hypothetical protein
VWSFEVNRRFGDICSSLSSGLKSKPNKKPVMKQAASKGLLGLLFSHEGGSDMFLQNVG